jgi:ferredoxin
MKVSVDHEGCVASGACVTKCSTVFDQDDDGIVILKNEAPLPEDHAAVREAEAACPASVIFVEN